MRDIYKKLQYFQQLTRDVDAKARDAREPKSQILQRLGVSDFSLRAWRDGAIPSNASIKRLQSIFEAYLTEEEVSENRELARVRCQLNRMEERLEALCEALLLNDDDDEEETGIVAELEPEPERKAPAAETKSLRPVITTPAYRAIEAEAKRSNMTPRAYLTNLVGDYAGSPDLGVLDLEPGSKVQVNLDLPLDVHKSLQADAARLGSSMAHVVRWMIPQEVGGAS